MRIIRPVDTPCDNILASNVTQDVPDWVSTTTYAKGDLVVYQDCQTVYESLTNSNTGNIPPDSPLEWLAIGASNYYALFDGKNGTQTENLESISYTVSFDQVVNSIALINLDKATTVQFEAWTSDQDYTVDTPTFDETVNLRDYGVSDFYEYWTYTVKERKNYTSFDFGTVIGGTGRMTLSGATGETVKVGSLVYGNQFYIGKSLWGAGFGIKDYSTKETDEFGNYRIVEREFKDRITVEVLLENNHDSQPVKDVLSQYRARPLLWSASDKYQVVTTYGYYTRFDGLLETPAGTKLNLEIQGL